MKGIVIKDDSRYYHMEKYLAQKNFVFAEETEPAESLDFLIFPFKENIDANIYNSEYFGRLKKGALVFSGVYNAYIDRMCQSSGRLYFAMMDDKGVAVKNAVPTSEGVISYVIANTDDTLSGSSALVIGYGVCGRDLCRRLKALSANVSALVRGEIKESEAIADGITPVYLEDLGPTAFDVIVNTVPARVLTNDNISRFRGALLIDIASAPYGFDMEFAKQLNCRSALMSGIPGKYATKRAGEILGKFVYDKRCEYV